MTTYPEMDLSDKCAFDKMSFDEAGVVEVCLHADLAFCDKARPIIHRIMRECDIEMDIGEDSYDVANREIATASIYNEKFRDIVEGEYEYDIKIDEYGALCYKDNAGWHCGDGSGQFPLYVTEEYLRKNLEEDRMRNR